MLDKQEEDRRNEMKSREARAQEFMNKMADSVINKMNQKQQWEDEMIARYEKEREAYQRNMEQKRLDRVKNDQDKMRNFLNQQMLEKKQREADEKANID